MLKKYKILNCTVFIFNFRNDAPSKETASDKTSAEIKKVVAISPCHIAPKEPELIREVPEGVEDFDKENWDDIFQASHYAMDIFEHLKSREV